MHRPSYITALGIVVAVIVMSGAVTYGYALASYHWLVNPVLIYVNPTNRDVSADAAEAAVKVGMAAWNGKTHFQYLYGGRVKDTATSIDGRNVVIFRNATNGSAVATTYSWSKSGARFDSDTVFWDATYRFYTGTSGCSSGVYIEDVAAHELGHTAGLLHSSLTDATMYGVYRYCGMIMRTLSSDDIAGLKKLYP